MKSIVSILNGALRAPNLRKRRSRQRRTRTELHAPHDPAIAEGSETRLNRRRLYLGAFAYFVLVCGITAFGAVCLFIMSDQAFGQEASAAATAQASGSAATRIEVDEEAGAIRFFIDGHEKARLDAAGLHVRENIDYGGTLTDYGQKGFDDHIRRNERQRLKNGGRDAP